MSKTKFVYTIISHGKKYVVTSKQFEDKLAIMLGDTDYICDWCGITSANYDKARRAIRKMKTPRCSGYVFENISFAIYSEEEFNNRKNKAEYQTFNGDVHSL